MALVNAHAGNLVRYVRTDSGGGQRGEVVGGGRVVVPGDRPIRKYRDR